MTDFSPDHHAPSPRFRPGPGEVGARAGAAALRSRSGGGGRPRSGGRTMASPPQGPSTAPPSEQQPNDLGHLAMLAQHRNASDLGRDIPFGIWAINTGHFREIKADMKPYDYLEGGESL